MQAAITAVMAKGKVVLPEEIVGELGLNQGDMVLTYTTKDSIVVKKINAQKSRQLLEKAFKIFRGKKGFTHAEIEKEIQGVRKAKRAD